MKTLAEIDAALDGARNRYDHADAPYDPDVLGLIRAAEDMRDRLTLPTIRVIELADHDDQMVLMAVGPYDTEADRDAALARLQTLPGVGAYVELSASLVPTAAAERSCTAEAAAGVTDANGLLELMW